MEKILTRVPINKITAKVTSQKGCVDEITLLDKRDCLARALNSIEEELKEIKKKNLPKKIGITIRKELGVRKQNLQQQIKSVNKELKELRIGDRDLNEYIISECRSRFTKQKWNEILHAARGRKKHDVEAFDD